MRRSSAVVEPLETRSLLSGVTSVTTSGQGIANGTGHLNAGKAVTLTVNFDASVTVDSTNGLPTLSLNDGGTAAYSGGSGTAALNFSYLVGTGQNTTDLSVTAFNLNGATVRNRGIDVTLTGAVTNPAGSLPIDTIAPTVSMGRLGASSRPPGSLLQYTVTFSEAVSGVDASGFGLVTSGVTGATIISVVQGTDAAHYTVNVNGGSGSGTIGLNITGTNIRDLAGNGFGGGTFSAPQKYVTGNYPISLNVVDVNADGNPDVITANEQGNSISVLLGSGDGTFSVQQTYSAGGGVKSVTVGDMNADGKPDLVVNNTGDRNIGVRLGNGDGTFAAQQISFVGSFPYWGALGDVNRDGKLDLFIVNGASGGGTSVSVLLGKGDGTFQAERIFDVGRRTAYLILNDANGDGNLDIFVSDFIDSTVSLLLGNGNGTFSEPQSFAAGQYSYYMAMGDVNEDGKPDLFVANGNNNAISMFLGNGDGTFSARQTLSTGAFPTMSVLGDVNADGKIDLIVSNYDDGTVSVLSGNGNGTFAPQKAFSTGASPRAVALADVNKDGRPDLLVANYLENKVSVLLNVNSPQIGPTFRMYSGLPTITSPTVSILTGTSVALGGDVTDDAGSPITDRGIVYSLTSVNSDPQIGGTGVTQISTSGKLGTFAVNVNDLTNQGVYSFAAYATDPAGTSYTAPVTIFGVNLPPTLGGIESTPLAYKANDPASPPSTISNSIAVSDPDSNHLTKVTVQVTTGYQNDANGKDVLGFSNTNGITGDFDAQSGTLTLTGSAYVGIYREAIRSITFSSSGANVSTADRTLTIIASDDGLPVPAVSQPITRTVTVSTTNMPPILTGVGLAPISYTNGQAAVAVASAAVVSDVDSINLAGATIQITGNYQSGQDILTATTTGTGITSAFDASSGKLSLSGIASLAHYQAVLRSLKYNTNPVPGSTATRTLMFLLNDGLANSAAVTQDINVAAFNFPPVVGNIEAIPLAYKANASAVPISSTVMVTDPDSNNLTHLTVQITSGYQNDANGHDVLAFTNRFGISGSFDATSGTLTLSGTAYVGYYREALRTVTFTSTGTSVSNANRILTIIATDDGSPTMNSSQPVTRAVLFNFPPVVSDVESSRLVLKANDPPQVISSTVAVTDPDSNNLTKLTVQITSGYQNDANGHDVLAFTNQFGITGFFDADTGTLTLTGTAYVGSYREALRSVTFSSTGTNVSTADRVLTIVATDDGSPNSASSLPATRIVTAINRPPVVGNMESSPLACNANDPAVAISNTVTVTDPDSDYLTKMTIQITAGYQNDADGRDVLGFTNQFGITGSFDAASGTLTLTGTSYMGNYREALRSVTFKSTGTNVSSIDRVLTIIASDDSSPIPGLSVPILKTISVTTTNFS